MKNIFVKRIVSVVTCMAVFAQPLLLASCKKKDNSPTKPADYGSYGSDIAREIASKYPNRPAYSEGEAAAGEYIASKIKELGFDAEVQPFEGPEGGNSANYIVRFQGNGFYCEQADGTFEIEHRVAIIGTHYDAALLDEYVEEESEDEEEDEDESEEESEPEFIYDGISDNASGTACILTALMAFREYTDIAYDVWFVFFGAGTDNAAGAEAFYQSLTYEEKNMIDVMYDVDSLYAGDKVYASAGFKSLISSRKYEMRRKLYQSYDVCFSNTLYTNYGFDLLYNESGIRADINDDGIRDIFNELPLTISDYKVFDDRMIPIVYFESSDYNFTSLDQMKETKNLNLQEYGGKIRRTPADSTKLLDSVLLEEDYDRDGDGEIDCSGDRLQIRINCVAFIIVESLLKGSDKGMTPAQYEAYKAELAKQAFTSETSSETSKG